MTTLESLRRQLETAGDLASIVSTMKTLAAVSIHQYERALEALEGYNQTIELGFQIVFQRCLERPPAGPQAKTLAVLFGTSQGMCGQFNERIAEFFEQRACSRSPSVAGPIISVGDRLASLLRERNLNPVLHHETPSSVNDITDLVQRMLPQIEQIRSQQSLGRLVLFFNRRSSAATYQSTERQVLPVEPRLRSDWSSDAWKSRSLPQIAAEPEQLLSSLIQQHLFVALFTALAQSLASENASRISAMQAAEKNIGEKLDELRISFNQQRQTAITEELLDVVSGFEALKDKR
jgi:F-type H+-transporting ATPase subunit gamma